MTEATLTHDTLVAFSQDLQSGVSLGEALGISPCQALEMAFPAIVGDDLVMQALAMMLDPAIPEVAAVVATGAITPEQAETFLHNVYHVLQTAAAMGHALGVAQATGPVDVDDVIPASLEGIAWADLPDAFGEDEDAPEEV